MMMKFRAAILLAPMLLLLACGAPPTAGAPEGEGSEPAVRRRRQKPSWPSWRGSTATPAGSG